MAQVKTFKQLRDQVLAIAAEVGSSGLTKTLVDNALNDAHEERCTNEDWNFMLWRRAETLAIVADTRYYSLHPQFSRPYYFFNRTEKDWVREVPTSQLQSTGVDFIDGQAATTLLQFAGRSSVAAQPTAASALTVSSSAIGDGSAQSVTVIGDTADGIQEETILCDTTGTILFTSILKVRKDGTWDGTMTLAAGATTILTLLVDELGRSYPQIWLPENPDSSQTVEYKFYRLPFPLLEDNDIPDVPPPFSTVLVYDALLLLAGVTEPTPAELLGWKDKQKEILFNMRRANAEAMSLDTLPTFTTYIER